MDFTQKVYRELLATLKEGGFNFQTFREFLEKPEERVVILRHDVDLRPQNALVTALIERELGIYGSYYFRIVPESFNVEIVRKIHEMGHETGYHYETMDAASRKLFSAGFYGFGKPVEGEKRGILVDAAFELFKEELELIREVVPVSTAAMHGSPRSRFNNIDIWNKYDYRVLGIIGEPYLDVDFSRVLYLTDTGRRWDGSVTVRDRVESGFTGPEFRFRSTADIIAAAEAGRLPSQIMINVHPQRWTGSFGPWLRELVWQNIKNVVKRTIVKDRIQS